MLCLRPPLPLISTTFQLLNLSNTYRSRSIAACALKGPRPRSPRVWKTKKRIGTISKSNKLVECIKGLSNVKEEVYGALDSFVAWELEFPLIAVKKALKTLEREQEWKRIIQVIKWMLSKGQGRTMGTYFTLLNALAEDERIDEAEELWTKIFTDRLEGTPRMFFDKMISIYYKRDMHDKMFEIFADMEELGMRPNVPIVKMMGNVFRKLGMLDKYEKLKKKYPPPKWEYRYIKGKRVKVRAKYVDEFDDANEGVNKNGTPYPYVSTEVDKEDNSKINEVSAVEVSNQLDAESSTKSSEGNVKAIYSSEADDKEFSAEFDEENIARTGESDVEASYADEDNDDEFSTEFDKEYSMGSSEASRSK